MAAFSNLSIKRKQMLIITLTSIVALLLASAGFLTYELFTYRAEMVRNINGLAARVADKNTGNLAFDDPAAAEKELQTILQGEESIVRAHLYKRNGQAFAQYTRKGKMAQPPQPGPEGTRFQSQSLWLFKHIRLDGEVIGTLYLEADLTAMYERVRRYAGIVIVLTIVSTFVALLLSSALQRVISRPILHLLEVARKVSGQKNYAVRAKKEANDELGSLTDGFNEMLEQIQQRDAALQLAQQDLEKRVVERTAELQLEIVERSKAEQALRESEMKLHSVLQSATDGIVALDSSGKIVSWNKAAENIFGYDQWELKEQTFNSLVPEIDKYTKGVSPALVAGAGRPVELTARRKDGTSFPAELSFGSWRTADETFYSAIIRDITQRKGSEEALRQQFKRITLLNQITHAISERQDLKSILHVVLRELEDHLPIHLGSVLIYEEKSQTFEVAAIQYVQGLSKLNQDLRKHSKFSLDETGLSAAVAGNTMYLTQEARFQPEFLSRLWNSGIRSLVCVPLLVEGKVSGVLIGGRQQENAFSSGECEFFRMLSEHVALAAHQAELYAELQDAYNELRQTQHAVMQQERLRALGKMASGIAHDINNALSPVVVYSELILRNEPNLSSNSRKHLEHVKTAGEDIAHIVSRMREFYRKREESETLFALNLNNLVQQVIDLTRPRWKDIPQEKGIVVQVEGDFEPDMPELLGSASELREAITNLILNAVDALPTGGKVIVRTRSMAAEAGRQQRFVLLEVQDNGVGMDDETRTRCLEPFFSTKGQRGTGLGLAMVYGIVERHGGNIEIESVHGEGTTIRLVLPLREQTARLQRSLATTEKLAPMRILCIDDEPLLRELLRELLAADGHTVETADGGAAGIELFMKAQRSGQNFDAVITDLGMPHVDGRKVALSIKKEEPDIPIILLTGWGSMMKSDGDVPSQVDAVLSKPPRVNELMEALSQVTADKRKRIRLGRPMTIA